MEWLGLIIPVIIAIVYKVKFQRDILWWEYFATLCIAVAVIWGAGFAYSYGIASDVKIRSGYTCGKEFIPEHWVTVCVPVSCGENCTTTQCHQQYVPPEWNVRLGTVIPKYPERHGDLFGLPGEKTIDVTEAKYNITQLGETAVWEEAFQNPLRRSKANLYKPSKDKKYPNLDVPTIHNYYKMNRITNLSGISLPTDSNDQLSLLNSRLNTSNINLGFVISKYPGEFAQYNENYWRGGNPNDFVIFIGVDEVGAIQWVKSIKWGNELLALEIRDAIMDVKNIKEFPLILEAVTNKLKGNRFVEADFSKFDYIKVQFPTWMLFVIYIVTTIATIIALEGFRKNEFSENGSYSNRYYGRRRF